jgi:hypothetical protein
MAQSAGMQVLLELINGSACAQRPEIFPSGSSFCNQDIYCGNAGSWDGASTCWLYAFIIFGPDVVQLLEVDPRY